MATAKAVIGNVLGRFFFHDAIVTSVREVSPQFREVELEGPALRGLEWRPGDKIQVFLPETGTRTYTPLRWDTQKGTTAFLIYLHGSSPGASWGRELRVGARTQFFGPRRSLSLDDVSEPIVFFGDETAFGVAHALKRAVASREFIPVFEVSRHAESSPVLREFGFEDKNVERQPGEAHLTEVHERLRSALQAHPGACLVMTGKAQSIQTLKAKLKADGLGRSARVKPYWSVGKTGLD
ncbi:siderophore-interacting protein [Melittangium boletus]|uniref:NADPH-dependent ferric siderophore reductase n=1 Tax=Melittangium boletus DSM 14713 TaxID=1294270 RepID=A0A250IR82_9BACT|nr:siderophore-interacting protein [Melittangium boletus]ATB33762.1 NADPH-dependent ferric siderophore reductase [Melittangium boletus DSM 14713]